jgi:prophage tail gpP-like protein
MANADRLVDPADTLPGVDEVRVIVSGSMLTGWENVRVTRGIENGTSSFEMTCSADANAVKLLAQEGVAIQVSLGESIVLTGYVDTLEQILTPTEHVITISGRGKCEDLIDCSCNVDHIYPNTTLLKLATDVAGRYAIDIFVPPNGTQELLDALPPLVRRPVSITETAWEVIETYARYCGVLLFESELGELTISQAGTEIGGSGLAVGGNIEAITCTKSTVGRFSTMNAVLSAYSAGTDDEDIPNMPSFSIPTGDYRYRPLYFVSEQSATDRDYIAKRVRWMASRAYGMSRRVRLLVDSWRDSEGSVWIPNVNYPVTAPEVGVPDSTMLLLAEVTFILDQNGTHAELLLGPRIGYLPEPIALDVLPMDETTPTPGNNE